LKDDFLGSVADLVVVSVVALAVENRSTAFNEHEQEIDFLLLGHLGVPGFQYI
jgi:hypothetical protein